MDGITDFPFRLWVACAGMPDFFVTPFVRVTEGFCFRHVGRQFCPEAFFLPGLFPVPVVPQLMGSSFVCLARVAEPMLEFVDAVDVNCGCPAPTVVRHGSGSALLRSPEVFESFVNGLAGALGVSRFSIKMRTGIKDENEFERLVEVLRVTTPGLVTLHARTQREGYGGTSRWERVEQMARALACPVVGSGDVVDAESLSVSLALAPSVRGVMIGRGAMRDPWIFARLRENGPLKVGGRTMAWALAVFGLFCLACDQGDDEAFRLAEVARSFACGADEEAWREMFSAVSERIFHKNARSMLDGEVPLPLPRLKQVTKFLDDPGITFIKKDLLRAETASSFLKLLFTVGELERSWPPVDNPPRL